MFKKMRCLRGVRKEEGGRRKEEGGRRKEEGGRRKEEGGRRKASLSILLHVFSSSNQIHQPNILSMIQNLGGHAASFLSCHGKYFD